MNPELLEHTDGLSLVDHHCHGLLSRELELSEFELFATESEWDSPVGTSVFDSPFGIAVRAECAPLLGLERHCNGEAYIRQRALLGPAEVNTLLLRASGIGRYIVETGITNGQLLDPKELAEAAQASSSFVVRLETVAERLLEAEDSVETFAARFEEALDGLSGAVGYKTIVAYRGGLDFDPDRPTTKELHIALGEVFASRNRGQRIRLANSVVIRHLIWSAIDRKKPLQFHIGYGDGDIDLFRCDPTRMTEFIRRTRTSGSQIMLLHCYPFHREAGFLAQIYPHVYLDTGAAINYTGLGSVQVIRESLELAPFHKVLFSTDTYGLPELYLCGARLWRRGIAAVFSDWVEADGIGLADAKRYITMIGSDNAERVYGV